MEHTLTDVLIFEFKEKRGFMSLIANIQNGKNKGCEVQTFIFRLYHLSND